MTFKGALLRYFLVYFVLLVGSAILLYKLAIPGGRATNAALLVVSLGLVLYWYSVRSGRYLNIREMVIFSMFAFLLDGMWGTVGTFAYFYSTGKVLSLIQSWTLYFSNQGVSDLVLISVFVFTAKNTFKKMKIVNDQPA